MWTLVTVMHNCGIQLLHGTVKRCSSHACIPVNVRYLATIFRNGTERPIPLNTYFTELLKNKPKQLPTLELLFWMDVDGFQVNTTMLYLMY